MRLIDADALEERLADKNNGCAGECECCEHYLREKWEKGWCGLIAHAPTVATDTNVLGKWISVKDRLPENETEVIIIVQHKIGWYRALAWHDEYGWHSSAEEFGDGESDFVTYWTPLLETPEEVKRE